MTLTKSGSKLPHSKAAAGPPQKQMNAELKYLDRLQGSGIRPGLERMRAFLRAAGHPEHDVPAVIVAGTNGKGSTAATLASIVRAGGYRCALYISPHLVDMRERWTINGEPVSASRLRDEIRELRKLAGKVGFQPTYFEALTILAFLLFRGRCDLVVLEVGMGGRLDATNVVRPILSLITSVSFDHMEYLGNTLRKIAGEKAGVIHRGSIALTSSRHPDVIDVLRRRAEKTGSPLHLVADETRVSQVNMSPEHLRFRLKTPSQTYALASPLVGLHQTENIALAVRGAEELRERFPGITPQAIKAGVATTRWRGRLERFELPDRNVWVDGGHNVDAAERIVEFATTLPEPRTLVFGIMQDKEIRAVAEILFPRFQNLILTCPPSDRAAPAEQLGVIARETGRSFRIAARPADAFRKAVEAPGPTVMVCGSLYLAGAAIEFFDRRVRRLRMS